MPVPGHRQSPPSLGQNKKPQQQLSYYGSFPVLHIPFGQNGNNKQSPENSVFSSKRNSAPNRKPLPMINHVRKKHQSRSSDLQALTKSALPSQFPNDRLSPLADFSHAYSDWYRHGFTPCSLFTERT